MGDAGFPSLDKLFPQLAGSSYYRGRDVVMELGWVDGRPEVTPHSRCTAAAPQRMPTGCPAVPATTTWSGTIVRTRSVNEEAGGSAAMEAASNPTPSLSPALAQPWGCSGLVGHKRTRQQPVLAGADAAGGASGAASAGRGGASPIATSPGAPSSHLSRVEHASYATTMMTDDDVVFNSSREYDDDEDYYGDDTTLGPRDGSDQQPANDQNDSVGRSSRCVRSKQVCSGQRSGSKTNSLTTASMRERKRRDKFSRNIKLLQEIIPNTSKGDTVSILDRAIDHVKKLQSLAQMVGTRGGNPYQPMTAQDYMAHLMLAAQVTYTTGLGNGMGINLNQPQNIYKWPSFQYPPGFAIFGGTSINGLCNHVTK